MILRGRAGLGFRRPLAPPHFRPRRVHSDSQPSKLPESRGPQASSPKNKGPEPVSPSSDTASKTIPPPTHIWVDSLSAPLRAYTRAQGKHPYIVQLVSTLVVYLLGDISAQSINRTGDEPHDPVRTLRALIIGGLAAIPGYNWFLWLARNFNYSSKVFSIGVKVIVNQIVFTPIFNTYFFGMQSLLTGGGPTDIVERVKNTVPRSWINSWKLWPAVTAFSFAFVPLHFRNIFAGVIAIGWQTYLSFLNQKAAQAEEVSHHHLS